MKVLLNYCQRMIEQMSFMADDCKDEAIKAHLYGQILAYKNIMLVISLGEDI